MTKLRNVRKKIGMSLSAFSHDIGINYSFVCQVERGEIKVSPKWQAAIAERLELSVETLFNEKGFAREADI